MKKFLDDSMEDLNDSWSKEQARIESLTQEIFLATASALKIFGAEVGRKFKGGRYERSLNRALFEVQAYYLSFPRVRAAAAKNKPAIVRASKQLFADNDFTASIESTTKSLENYPIRFGRYQRMLKKTLGVDIPPLEIPPAT